MHNKNSKRINGAALESIMQDVLQGMHDFTSEVCIGSESRDMEIIAVEEPAKAANGATIIPFPLDNTPAEK